MDRKCGMRRAERKRLAAILETVEQNPGIRAGRVARELNLHRSVVARALQVAADRVHVVARALSLGTEMQGECVRRKVAPMQMRMAL
jgi:hypothetical protein